MQASMRSFICGAVAGLALTASIGYLVFYRPLADVHTRDELRAVKAEQLADKYHADYLTAQGSLDATRTALDRANSRIGDLIGRAGSASGTGRQMVRASHDPREHQKS